MDSPLLKRLTRIPGFMRLWFRFPRGGVDLRTAYDVWDRPNYAFGLYSSAHLARSLGLARMTAVEFGVAGGNGLLAMERIAREVGDHFGIQIDVFGFDSGMGMPAPVDYRDLPHCWEAGFYRMDRARLEAKLERANLLIGDVAETVDSFLQGREASPIGFIAFDLDYYSSTVQAFRVFSGRHETRLPRVYCYFDDTIWPQWACHNDHVGELLAIREFNTREEGRLIAPISGLRWMRRFPAAWNEQMYVMHDFSHPKYTQRITPEGDAYTQIPLGE